MSSEERPESLAAQAAAWVPPWERRREPDREFQDSAGTPDGSGEPGPVEDFGLDGDPGPVGLPEPAPVDAPVELPEPASVDVPVELPLASGPEPVELSVASGPEPVELPVVSGPGPVELPVVSGPGPVEVEPGPEIAVPAPVREAAEPEPAPVADARATVPSQPRRPRNGGPAVVENVTPTPAPVLMDDAELAAALESIMLVVDEPVGELQLAQVLGQSPERVARTLENVSARYTAAGHGIDLRRVAGGWRLYTRPEYAAYVERFVLDGQSVRLTQAALETLAVVAYKQPVTRSRISAIRGVNCDGVMRTLVTRGLIEECGTEPETGAYLYRTTPLFLEKLGLDTVDQLPPLAPFLPDDVEEVLDASG